MAKNTHSQEALTGTSDSYSEHELADPIVNLRNRPVLGEVDNPSAQEMEDGTDYSQSSESAENRTGFDNLNRPSPAQTTESPSSTTAMANSSVDSMGGAGQEAGQSLLDDSDVDDDESTEDSEDEELPYDQWTVTELQAECRERKLIVSGTKAELISRLEANDADNPTDDFE